LLPYTHIHTATTNMKVACLVVFLALVSVCVAYDGGYHDHDSDCRDLWTSIKLSVDTSRGHAWEENKRGMKKMTYCEYYKERGMCERKHKEVMMEFCMKTCGFC